METARGGFAGPEWSRMLDDLAAVCLFAMMALEFVDVVGRYGLNRPLPGSTEIKQYLLALSLFLAVPVVAWKDEHISISLIEGRFGAVFNRVRRVMVRLVSGGVMFVLGWCLWRHAGLLAENRDIIGYLRLPVAPAAYAVALLSFLTGIVFFAAAAAEARGLQRAGVRDPRASAD